MDFQRLSLYVDPDNLQTKIMKVRTGANPEIITIVVQQSPASDVILVWDIKADSEIESFDTMREATVFWDSLGSCYITEGEKVTLTDQGVNMMCYPVSKINRKR